MVQVCQQQASETRLTVTDVSTTFLVVIVGCTAALGLFLLERAVVEVTLLLKEALRWWQEKGTTSLKRKFQPKVFIES